MKKCWCSILIILPVLLYGQNNLVPNGDFESYLVCPTEQGQIPPPWASPTWNFFGSPDYFNSCTQQPDLDVPQNGNNFQIAHSGNAYGGMICFQRNQHNLREYLQIELNDTIIKRVPYIVNFWLSLRDVAKYSIGSIGAYFSQTAVQDMEILNFTLIPQIINEPLYPLDDKENWMLITDTFVSDVGGEKYLTLGNFYEDSLTDTVFLSSGQFEYVYAYYYIDDVSVIPLDSLIGIEEKKEFNFLLFPNPVNNSLTIETGSNQLSLLSIYDITGRQIGEWSMVNGKKIIDVSNFADGVYVVQLQSPQGMVSRKFVKR